MKLEQLQHAFQAHLLRGESGIQDEIIGDARAAVQARLRIYDSAYAARLVEVLGESFPAVRRALGHSRFERCIGEFVRQNPSRFRSARAYGEALSPWLAASLAGPRAHGVAELARFEWAMADAFDAADATALKPASLADIDPAEWSRLQFTFSPTLQRLNLTSNAVAWWRFACAGEPRPGRWRATAGQRWLVWREELAVFYRRLSLTEAQALDAAREGSCFGELCTRLSPAQAARVLHDWFSAGLIVKIALRTVASGA